MPALPSRTRQPECISPLRYPNTWCCFPLSTCLAEIAFPLLVTTVLPLLSSHSQLRGSGLSMSVGTENNHPSFFGESWHGAAAASLEKPQGHFQAVVLLALSTHIFRSIAFSAVRVKYFPTFALSSFQMPEMETGIARKQQHSQLL